jgi:hypothetical protein
LQDYGRITVTVHLISHLSCDIDGVESSARAIISGGEPEFVWRVGLTALNNGMRHPLKFAWRAGHLAAVQPPSQK